MVLVRDGGVPRRKSCGGAPPQVMLGGALCGVVAAGECGGPAHHLARLTPGPQPQTRPSSAGQYARGLLVVTAAEGET